MAGIYNVRPTPLGHVLTLYLGSKWLTELTLMIFTCALVKKG